MSNCKNFITPGEREYIHEMVELYADHIMDRFPRVARNCLAKLNDDDIKKFVNDSLSGEGKGKATKVPHMDLCNPYEDLLGIKGGKI